MQENDTNTNMVDDAKPNLEWSLYFNKNAHKLYKIHCDANIVDGAFIKQFMREIICVNYESEQV